MIKVSVVLPTYNRLNQLKQVLASLETQSQPLEDFEVVVVSDGSTDGTNGFLETMETPLRLTAVFQTNQGVAVARNHGVEQAASEIILFIDDDVVPAPQLIEEHLRAHNAYRGDVIVLGPMLSPPDFRMSPWTEWEQAMLLKQYEPMKAGDWEPTARQFYTGNTSLARRLIVAAGGFDPAFRRAEDVELAYRLTEQDVRFVFNDRAVGYHYVERTFVSWMATPYAYGRNDVIFTVHKGQDWLLPTALCEYRERHVLIRVLTRLCLDRPFLSRVSIAGLKLTAQLGGSLSVSILPRLACSGIFNLRYYQGMADELNGRSHFYRAVKQARLPAQPSAGTRKKITGDQRA